MCTGQVELVGEFGYEDLVAEVEFGSNNHSII